MSTGIYLADDYFPRIFGDRVKTKAYFARAARETNGWALGDLVEDLEKYAAFYGISRSLALVTDLKKTDRRRVLSQKPMAALTAGLKCFWENTYPAKADPQPRSVIDIAFKHFSSHDFGQKLKIAKRVEKALVYELDQGHATLEHVGYRLSFLVEKKRSLNGDGSEAQRSEVVEVLAGAGQNYLETFLDRLAPQTQKRFGGMALKTCDVHSFADNVDHFLCAFKTKPQKDGEENGLSSSSIILIATLLSAMSGSGDFMRACLDDKDVRKKDLLLKTYVVLANGNHAAVSDVVAEPCCGNDLFRRRARSEFQKMESAPVPFFLRSVGIAPKFKLPLAENAL